MSERTLRGFAGPAEFRAWLEQNGASVAELYLRCAKVAVGSGLTYREALDEALCVGWIDGVRHAVDATSFSVRFTPRKPKSAWSTVNIRRYRELVAEGRVRPAGRRAFETGVKSRYSFESRPQKLAPAYLGRIRANARAWRFFEAQAPGYRRLCAFWVMSAKQPETRERRLLRLVACSARHQAISPLTPVRPLAATRGGRLAARARKTRAQKRGGADGPR